jgi:hypothetical protein
MNLARVASKAVLSPLPPNCVLRVKRQLYRFADRTPEAVVGQEQPGESLDLRGPEAEEVVSPADHRLVHLDPVTLPVRHVGLQSTLVLQVGVSSWDPPSSFRSASVMVRTAADLLRPHRPARPAPSGSREAGKGCGARRGASAPPRDSGPQPLTGHRPAQHDILGPARQRLDVLVKERLTALQGPTAWLLGVAARAATQPCPLPPMASAPAVRSMLPPDPPAAGAATWVPSSPPNAGHDRSDRAHLGGKGRLPPRPNQVASPPSNTPVANDWQRSRRPLPNRPLSEHRLKPSSGRSEPGPPSRTAAPAWRSSSPEPRPG